jgi:hypothetical protein
MSRRRPDITVMEQGGLVVIYDGGAPAGSAIVEEIDDLFRGVSVKGLSTIGGPFA